MSFLRSGKYQGPSQRTVHFRRPGLGFEMLEERCLPATLTIAPGDSIQDAINQLQPGETVFLKGGDYFPSMTNASDNLLLRAGVNGNNGRADAWITIRNAPGERPVLHLGGNVGISISDVSYIRMEGLELVGSDNGTGGGIYAGYYQGVAHHLQIIDCTVHNFGGAGISTTGSQVLLEGNTVYDCCKRADNGPSGIVAYQPVLQFDDNSGFAGPQGNPDNLYSLIIRGNTVFDCINNVPNVRQGFDRPTDGNGIILDDFQHTQSSSFPPYAGRTLVSNNVLYNNGGAGILTNSSDHIDVFNNTLFKNARNATGSDLENFGNDNRFFNNIVHSAGGTTRTANYSWPRNGSTDFTNNGTWANNLYYNLNGDPVRGTGDIRGLKPNFVQPGLTLAADFHIKANSPAVGKGYVLLPVPLDRDGNFRSRVNLTALGAYEAPPSAAFLNATIALTSILTGNYLTAESAGNDPLVSNRIGLGTWERFIVVDAGNFAIALKSLANGKFVSTRDPGAVAALSTTVTSTERFQLVAAGDGRFALRSLSNRLFLAPDATGYAFLTAKSPTLLPEQMFLLTKVTQPSSQSIWLTQLPGKLVAFTLSQSGGFVTAETSGQDSLVANRAVIGPWERFLIVNAGSGAVALQAVANGKYVSLQADRQLLASANSIGAAERFAIVRNNGGFALKSLQNGLFVTGSFNGSLPLRATSAGSAGRQHLKITILEDSASDPGSLLLRGLPIPRTVAILSSISGALVSAESAGNDPLVANRPVVGPWEQFAMLDAAGSTIALRALVNNLLVSAQDFGSKPLLASASAIGNWERFLLVAYPGGKFALRSLTNGLYVTADPTGSYPLKASSDTVGTAQLFSLTVFEGEDQDDWTRSPKPEQQETTQEQESTYDLLSRVPAANARRVYRVDGEQKSAEMSENENYAMEGSTSGG